MKDADKTKAQLIEELAELRKVADSSSDYIMRYDSQLRHTYANRAAVEVLGLPKQAYIGKTHRELGFPDHLCQLWESKIKRVFETGQATTIELTVELTRGPVVLELSLHPEHSPDDRIVSVLGVSHDVSQRSREVEDNLMLVREVHHRVKNNLQVITGLLRLQARGAVTPVTRAALLTAGQRIQAIALLHDSLQRPEELADTFCPVYINNVIEALRRAHAGPSVVRFTKQIGDIYLDILHASSVGLVVNELAANAVEHAFPAGGSGEVTISLQRVGTDQLELIVSDDGVGLPDDVDPETTTSLGLRLVNLLVNVQLGGTLEVSREGGTTFTMRFVIQGVGGAR